MDLSSQAAKGFCSDLPLCPHQATKQLSPEPFNLDRKASSDQSPLAGLGSCEGCIPTPCLVLEARQSVTFQSPTSLKGLLEKGCQRWVAQALRRVAPPAPSLEPPLLPRAPGRAEPPCMQGRKSG